MHLGIDVPEAVLAVRLFDLALQEQGAIDRPAIQGQHFLGRQQIRGRIETVQVGQQEARGIADPPVGIGATLENLLGYRDLARVIGRSHPQAQDVGAQGIDDGLRHHGVAQRLGHLAAGLVDGETVGQQLAVRRMVVDRAAGQQRGVEPAAVLVGTFQVEIGDRAAGMADPVGTTQHVPMGGAGVEPDVQGVVDLLVLRGLLAEQARRRRA